jgi:hypothetical protein
VTHAASSFLATMAIAVLLELFRSEIADAASACSVRDAL